MLSQNGRLFVPASEYVRGTAQPYWNRGGLGRYRRRSNRLGQWSELIGAAAGSYASGSSGASAGGAGPGAAPMGAPSSNTNVSPTIQTTISPQISPVFQQTQGSPGATQAATTTQQNPGGQTAYPSAMPSAFAPAPVPAPPANPGVYPSPSYLDPSQFSYTNPGNAGDMISQIQKSAPFNWTPVLWIAGIAAIGAIAIVFLKKRR